MPGKIIGVLITGGVGVLLAVLGLLIWKKEKIELLHDYHVNKVSAKNKTAFCTLSGVGVLVIGLGLLVTAALFGLTESLCSFLPFAAGLIAGIALLMIAGRRYNR